MKSFFLNLIHSKKIVIGLWCSVIVFTFLKHHVFSTPHNNYAIYKYVYVHASHDESIFQLHPDEYKDKNHYGPVFSMVFAPFALLPDWLGELLWVSLGVLFLLWAVYALPLKEWQKNGMLLICLNELLTAGFNVQFNIALAGIILFSYILIIREKEFLAPVPFLIALFIKLYGIVALSFFFFVKNKSKYILACVAWSIVLFIAPMIISSPGYVIDTYVEWFYTLIEKNGENVSLLSYQDISVMGFFRRCLQNSTIPNFPFILGGIVLFALPYLRISQYKQTAFQLLLVASTLMFPVLFSSSSEGSTYIVVFVGIALWFVIQPRPYTWVHWTLLALVIFFATLNSTDVYPRAMRQFLALHSIKAVPCTLVWLRIIYEMMTKNFATYTTGSDEPTVVQSDSLNPQTLSR